MAMKSPLDAVAELQAVVAQLAPTLRPQVLPKGMQYGLDLLLRLCATDEQRKSLRDLLHQRASIAAAENGKALYVVGAFDMDRKAFAVSGVQWLNEDEALVHELPRFIELQFNDPEKANDIITLFLKANGHKKDDVMVAQQCFNAAFALQAILRAFPELPVTIHGKTIELTQTSDVSKEIVDVMFPSKKKPSASAAKSDHQPAKKSKKRKGNKP